LEVSCGVADSLAVSWLNLRFSITIFRKQCQPVNASKNEEKLCQMFQLDVINVSVDI